MLNYFYNYSRHTWFQICKTIDHGECGEEILCYIMHLVQSAQLLGTMLHKFGKHGKQDLQVSLINLSGSYEIVGVRTWQFAKPNLSSTQTSCTFPQGGGYTLFTIHPLRGVSTFGQVYILMPTTIWSYYLNKKYLGAKSQWKKLEIHVYNVHHGKLLIILWYSSDGICESQVRGCNLVGQGFRV